MIVNWIMPSWVMNGAFALLWPPLLSRAFLMASWTPTVGFIQPSPSLKGLTINIYKVFRIFWTLYLLWIFWLLFTLSVQVCGSTGPWPCPPWSCSSQDERQRARLPQVLPGDESGRIFLYNIDVLVFSGCTIKLITFWFSVGVLCALLPSWPLLCAKIHLEGCRGGQGQHACCGKIDELSEININNSWLWFFKNEMSFSFFNCNIRMSVQDMYGPSMVINSSDRSERIKTIVKYFKEMRGGWEISALRIIKKCRY